MRIFPPITVGTTPFVFDPAAGRRRLKYLRVNSETGGQTVYMGPTPEVSQVVLIHVILLSSGTLRLKLSDYEIQLNNDTDPTAGAGSYVEPGWVITNGSDAGVTVKKVYDGFIEFSSALGVYADDAIALSPPYFADTINGYPILAASAHEFTDEDVLRGPISFGTGSGTATLNLLFELT